MRSTTATKSARPTLAKVAQLAGVHPTTVSLVLNNRANCWASDETRQRIVQAADKLNYRPHLQARSLRSGQSHSIGFVTTALDTIRRIKQLDRRAMELGYTLLTSFNANSASMEKTLIQRFSDHSVDGLLIYPSEQGPHEGIRKLTQQKFPLVTFDGRYHLDFDCPSVGPDMAQAGRLQAEHLLACGRRRICIARPVPAAKVNLVREAAAMEVLEQAGVEPIICPIERDANMETSESLELAGPIDRYVAREAGRFDAVIAFDTVASLFIRSLISQGLRVPDDVAVVGSGNSVLATHGMIGITSIDCGDAQHATYAMDWLVAQINRKPAPSPPSASPKLVVRSSSSMQHTPTGALPV